MGVSSPRAVPPETRRPVSAVRPRDGSTPIANREDLDNVSTETTKSITAVADIATEAAFETVTKRLGSGAPSR